jgi:hypothetical protein
MEDIKYGWAEAQDQIAIQSLLKKCDLPYETSNLSNFVVARAGDAII